MLWQIEPITYGSFILINIQHVPNDIMINRNPTDISNILFSFGVEGLCVWSKTMNPRPPMVNKKLEAKPSIIYCPLILYGIKATGLECPCSSVVEPTLGGSTITS